jgi:hypothetical protein
MGYFFSLFSLSKSATSGALNWSELGLFAFGVVLVVGLVGEYKVLPHSRRMKLFEMFVIIGVAGELLADGGIFLFSHQLQVISDSEITEANKNARDAASSAKTAGEEADAAGIKAGKVETVADAAVKKSDTANDTSGKATVAAKGALNLAGDVKEKAELLDREIVAAFDKLTDLQAQIEELRSPRPITGAIFVELHKVPKRRIVLQYKENSESALMFARLLGAKLFNDPAWGVTEPKAIASTMSGICDIRITARDAQAIQDLVEAFAEGYIRNTRTSLLERRQASPRRYAKIFCRAENIWTMSLWTGNGTTTLVSLYKQAKS